MIGTLHTNSINRMAENANSQGLLKGVLSHKTGNFCMAEKRKFLHGIDSSGFSFDSATIP
jgi:hypothetical protein